MPIVECITKLGDKVEKKKRGIFRLVLSDKDYPRDQLRGIVIIGSPGETSCSIMPGDLVWYKEGYAYWTSKPFLDGISSKNSGQDIKWQLHGRDFDIYVGEFYRKS